MGVKEFATTGTAGQTGITDGKNQQYNPANENRCGPHAIVGGIEGNRHRRQISSYHQPQNSPPETNLIKAGTIICVICRLVTFHDTIHQSIWLIISPLFSSGRAANIMPCCSTKSLRNLTQSYALLGTGSVIENMFVAGAARRKLSEKRSLHDSK